MFTWHLTHGTTLTEDDSTAVGTDCSLKTKQLRYALWQRIKAIVKSLLHSTFEDFKKKELYIKAIRCTCISIFLYQQRRPIQKKTFALIIRPNLSYILNVFLFYKSLVPQNAIYCYIKCKNKILLTSIRACVRSLVRKDIKEQVLLIIHGRQVCSPSFFDKKHG